MTTGVLGNAARAQSRQVVNTWRGVVNWNDTGIASGKAQGITIPLGAFISRVLVEVETAFNAVTTNVLTIGKTASGTELVAGGDVDLTTVGVYDVTRGLGTLLARSAAADLYAKYAQTGAAATAGKANILVEYEGNTG